jgi:DNA repair protein RecO (recombination protein O)
MEWRDEGIVLGVKRHGEGSVIIEVMTRGHGRHLGLVRGGRSARQRPVLQPGNGIGLVWRARLDEHLGHYTVEGGELRAARLIGSSLALAALGYVALLLRLLPERDPHPALYEAVSVLMEHLDDAAIAPPLLARFELAMLGELGVGLDLAQCAATGATQSLAYVSPKSGRAVSEAAGAPYRDKLFPLPAFLRDGMADALPGEADLAAAFALTGHFLARHVFEPRGMGVPEARSRVLDIIGRR